MVEMIREAGWEGFMALWEKFQEAVASSAHTQIFPEIFSSAHAQIEICTHTNVNLHTHKYFICTYTNIP